MKDLLRGTLLCFVLINGLKAESLGDGLAEGQLKAGLAEGQLKAKADIAQDNSATGEGFVYPYFFEIKDASNAIRARLNLTKGPFLLDLVKTTTTGNKVVYVKNEKKQIILFGNSSFQQTNPTTSAVVTGNGVNGTKIDITIAYDGMFATNSTFIVRSAEIKLSVELGGPTRMDYWNITAASIEVNSTVNSTAANLSLDLTPKFGYSSRTADFACTTGFGICAPLGLCWSCDDQVMKPNNLTAVGTGNLAVFLHFPGMVLQPVTGNTTTGFGYNWDCDPLIPISLWVSLLVTLMLASILFWALYMLSALQTPNKFDDPKGPSIHVPQAE